MHAGFDDHFRHVQADACTQCLGGKVGLENMLHGGGRDAAPVVGNHEGGVRSIVAEPKRHHTARRVAGDNRLLGIAQEIEQHLRKFIGKADDPDILAQFQLQLDVIIA